MRGVKITKEDRLFSKLVRGRDNYTCQRCHKKFPSNSPGLHCSHFFGRSNKTTRFDPENADALCYGCHQIWETMKAAEYRDFKREQLGLERYKTLERKARTDYRTLHGRAYGKVERDRIYKALKEQGLDYVLD